MPLQINRGYTHTHIRIREFDLLAGGTTTTTESNRKKVKKKKQQKFHLLRLRESIFAPQGVLCLQLNSKYK